MVRENEIPTARAVPIRSLYAQLKDAIPTQSAYRDAWHMHRTLDKASGAFMYTLLTGHCALDDEPTDTSSLEWSEWMAHKIGYETAWNVMHLSGTAPGFKVLPASVDSTSVTLTESAMLSVSFVNPPAHDVTVTLTSDNDSAITYTPNQLVFTPDNHATPQTITLTGQLGQAAQETVVITSTTQSDDPGYDAVVDRWEYTVIRN